MSNENELDEIVFPSKPLAVEEELLPGFGTHVENHEVKASVFGRVDLDTENYRAKVYSYPKGSMIPRRRQTVIGQVVRVSRSSVKIDVRYINNKTVTPVYPALMHISDASRDYIKNLDDAYAAGDIIRASIIDAKTLPIQLESKKNDHGVIYSTCDVCGEETKKVKRDQLKCTSCDHKQKRKTAIDFARFNIKIRD